MRDIDFDELDKAVNNYLGKGSSNQPKKESAESTTIDDAPKEMVFAPRRIVSASDFHSNLISGEIKESGLVKNEEDAPEIKEAVKTSPKLDLHDNFAEKNVRTHARKHSDILDNFEAVNFEAPVLGEDVAEQPEFFEVAPATEKVLPEIESKIDSEKSVDNFKPAEVEEFKVESAEPKAEEATAPIENSPILTEEMIAPKPFVREVPSRIAVPERPGLHQIAESENELVVFAPEQPSAGEENTEAVEQIPENDEEKIEVQISKTQPVEDGIKEEAAKISVNFIEESNEEAEDSIVEQDDLEIKEEPVKLSVEIEEAEPQIEEVKEAEIVSQVVTPEKISPEEIKTPFVQNPKIEKRPLGSSQVPQGVNFDIKPIDRSREIRRAKTENAEPSAPMMVRDEYSAPIAAKKKKSGWLTVAIVMLLLAVFGAGGGYAIWYFFGR